MPSAVSERMASRLPVGWASTWCRCGIVAWKPVVAIVAVGPAAEGFGFAAGTDWGLALATGGAGATGAWARGAVSDLFGVPVPSCASAAGGSSAESLAPDCFALIYELRAIPPRSR